MAMHVSDGILPYQVWLSGYGASALIMGKNLREIGPEEMPKVAVITAVFFVASLIHVPLGPTSVHLILNGLAGIILGPLAFVAIALGIILQTLLFQHGGLTTIGINSIIMGLPAIGAAWIFRWRRRVNLPSRELLFGIMAGGSAPALSSIILALVLTTGGSEFIPVAEYALVAHLPIMVIEGMMSGFIVSFLKKIKPEILE